MLAGSGISRGTPSPPPCSPCPRAACSRSVVTTLLYTRSSTLGQKPDTTTTGQTRDPPVQRTMLPTETIFSSVSMVNVPHRATLSYQRQPLHCIKRQPPPKSWRHPLYHRGSHLLNHGGIHFTTEAATCLLGEPVVHKAPYGKRLQFNGAFSKPQNIQLSNEPHARTIHTCPHPAKYIGSHIHIHIVRQAMNTMSHLSGIYKITPVHSHTQIDTHLSIDIHI